MGWADASSAAPPEPRFWARSTWRTTPNRLAAKRFSLGCSDCRSRSTRRAPKKGAVSIRTLSRTLTSSKSMMRPEGAWGITSSSMYSAQGCEGWASCALGHHGLTVTPSSRSAASTLPAMCRQNTHFESHPPRVTKSTSTTACPAARSCSATCLRRLDLPIWRGAKT